MRQEDRPGDGTELASRLADACASAGLHVLPTREPDPAPPHLLRWSPAAQDRRPRPSELPDLGLAAAVCGSVALVVLVGLYLVAGLVAVVSGG